MVRTPSRSVLAIALGVLLLANPFYVGALDLDETNQYRYESGEVSYGESGIEAPDRPLPDAEGIDDDAACLRGEIQTRTCAIERAILERGGLTVPADARGLDSNLVPTDYRYVYIDGRFYDTEVERRNGSTVLTLNRTAGETALASVSLPLSNASPAVRTAVKTGSVQTHRELTDANQLFRHDGDYYVVYPVEKRGLGPGDTRNTFRALGDFAEGGLTVLGMAAGLWFVLWGQRRRVERERRD